MTTSKAEIDKHNQILISIHEILYHTFDEPLKESPSSDTSQLLGWLSKIYATLDYSEDCVSCFSEMH